MIVTRWTYSGLLDEVGNDLITSRAPAAAVAANACGLSNVFPVVLF